MDPTTVRLSDTFMLSDFMGCDSIYRWGLANRMDDKQKMYEGKNLAQYCDLLQEEFGPCMVSYGYISPEVSRRIITYQNPDMPSYHRWDKGAAADLRFPDMLREGDNELSPIVLVREIEERDIPYSRLITYAESGWVCFGTNRAENGGEPRKALYENRWEGQTRPRYITYPKGRTSRLEKLSKATEEMTHPWEGKGYPTYHGGGRKQLHHTLTSQYTCMSSFLYDKFMVRNGKANTPPLGSKKTLGPWMEMAYAAGDVIDAITQTFGHRFSIIRGYNAHKTAQAWVDDFTLEVIPSRGVDAQDVAQYLSALDGITYVALGKSGAETTIRIRGELCDS
jgi:hypothetical protein